MVHRCCVLNCKNNSRMHPHLSFYSFPKNATIRKRWAHAINRVKAIHNHTKVCSAHFQKSDTYITGKVKRLHRMAVPNPNANLTSQQDKLFIIDDNNCSKYSEVDDKPFDDTTDSGLELFQVKEEPVEYETEETFIPLETIKPEPLEIINPESSLDYADTLDLIEDRTYYQELEKLIFKLPGRVASDFKFKVLQEAIDLVASNRK